MYFMHDQIKIIKFCASGYRQSNARAEKMYILLSSHDWYLGRYSPGVSFYFDIIGWGKGVDGGEGISPFQHYVLA